MKSKKWLNKFGIPSLKIVIALAGIATLGYLAIKIGYIPPPFVNSSDNVNIVGTIINTKTGLNFSAEGKNPQYYPIENPTEPLKTLAGSNKRIKVQGIFKDKINNEPGCNLSQIGCNYKVLFIGSWEYLN